MSELVYQPFGSLLSRIVDNRGKTCPTSHSGIPLIATNCIQNSRLYPQHINVRYIDQDTYSTWFRGHPDPGDMIFVTKGSPGRVAWVPDPVGFCIAQDMVAIKPDETKVYPKYLFAALRSKQIQDEIEGLHVGTLIPHFKKGDFNDLFIPIPDRPTQTVIGDMYFDLSLKIDLLHRQNKTLEAMAETLFRQWFVEEAKEDWEWCELGEYIDVHRGLSYKGSGLRDDESGIPMHNLNSVYEGGGYKYEGIKYYSGDYKERHLVRPGDIIIANTEQGHDLLLIGYPAIVPKYYGNNGIFSQHIYKLEIKSDTLSGLFLYFLLMSTDVRDQITGATNGSTVNMLPKNGIEWAKFRLPPPEKINAYSEIVEPFFEKKEANFIQIRHLQKLRDTILPKLMSGEVRIKMDKQLIVN
jgi:type I restriction enzyme, S subunit